MDLKTASDLDLAKAQGAQYQEMLRVQNNLLMINVEIERRTPKVEVPKVEPKTE